MTAGYRHAEAQERRGSGMKSFVILSVMIAVSCGLYESFQWFREPSLAVWAERTWFATGGALVALLYGWATR